MPRRPASRHTGLRWWSGTTPRWRLREPAPTWSSTGSPARSACGRPRGAGVGAILALANKESLIVGGPLVKALARPGQIVPVDSEHSAIAQSLRGGRAEEVRRLVVTASGGPFRGRSREELRSVTPDQALAHPNSRWGG